MYVAFLLATPIALRMLHREATAPYVALVLLAWLAAQTKLAGFAFYQVQLLLVEHGVPARFGLYFNLLGWQALYFGGRSWAFGRRRAARPWVPARCAVAHCLPDRAGGRWPMLGVYDLVVTQRMLGKDYSTQILTRTDRSRSASSIRSPSPSTFS
jgi:hypothetical protein